MYHSEIAHYITSEIAPDVLPSEIDPDYDLIENGVVDSLAMVRLVAWLGETFAIPINEIEVNPSELATINGINRFISGHTTPESNVTA